MLGILAHGGCEFFHRRGGFLEIGGLLLGAARQVAVAGGDLAGRQTDAAAGGLDARDDGRQLIHAGVAVIAHTGEHAVEIAFHALGEVTLSDGLQQSREMAEIAFGDLHQ
ncbi:hypothetical protein D3C71_1460190 [compost metagenome]